MFNKIKKRLTLYYSTLMAAFLIIFVIVTYSSLIFVVGSEEKQQLLHYAVEESVEHVDTLKRNELTKSDGESSGLDFSYGNMFYYVLDCQGNLAFAVQPVKELRQPVMDKIRHWATDNDEAVFVAIDLPKNKRGMLIMAARPITDGNNLLGTVYVGRDITAYYKFFKTILYILMAVLILFLALVTGFGYMMAGKAMIPIKQSFDRQREFVADASHELRTPLSVIMASADAVQGDEDSSLSAFARQVLFDMKDEIKKMSNIVSNLLTLARADSAVLKISKESFDLRPVAEYVVRTLQPLAYEKNIELILKSPEEVMVYADRERISQLMMILLDNGIKYTQDGGQVQIVIESLRSNGSGVNMMVTDTGIGIPETDHEMIFERFHRADKSRSRETGGTGLGLSIAKWIVDSHQGSIKVNSALGKGSTFTVRLPSR